MTRLTHQICGAVHGIMKECTKLPPTVIGGRGLPGGGDSAIGEESDDWAPRGPGQERAGQG
jgi:hypothetical protein